MTDDERMSSTFDRDPETYQKIVVDLCVKWNCYPEDLVGFIEADYQHGTDNADAVILLTAQNETLRDALKAARESEALLLAKLDAMGERVAMMQSALDDRRGYQTWAELKS